MKVTADFKGRKCWVDEEGWRGDDPVLTGRLMEFYPPSAYDSPSYGEPPPLTAARVATKELTGKIVEIEGENYREAKDDRVY